MRVLANGCGVPLAWISLCSTGLRDDPELVVDKMRPSGSPLRCVYAIGEHWMLTRLRPFEGFVSRCLQIPRIPTSGDSDGHLLAMAGLCFLFHQCCLQNEESHFPHIITCCLKYPLLHGTRTKVHRPPPVMMSGPLTGRIIDLLTVHNLRVPHPVVKRPQIHK